MEFFNPNSNVDFMGARRWTAMFSILIFVLSIGALTIHGLKWGLDFTGGTQIEVSYSSAADLPSIRESLAKAGFKEAQVVSYGTSKDVLISIAPREDKEQARLVDQVMTALPGANKQRVEFVGPQVGQELATKGALAVVVSLLATMIYIAMRFEYRLAVSSAVALVHDPVLILGIFAFFGVEFDLKALAGLLAVIGYSLNDTIVVFDRVRENFVKIRRATSIEIMNISINQTLSRTIMTSTLTLFVVLALFIYGGEAIHGFSLALIIGILIGTYSSIYVAGALAVAMGLDRKDFLPSQRKEIDNRP
ncbi:protein translocase subunit SecF [Legionella longbeachae]|uniref:Protein-export membrane protein SecF n=1 Tax=Legionella longbeachae serogroup 1 (strain NSW150) TaxID=661367 RepID=D3HQW0_LEGLN|nr:protein translocase subunit SecF [Legionella longbeachae]VEE01795.1 protein-export membrane protein SecF [Legionella oakridgensis]HBD7396546.1 protein translocase subunit SecF [Legionella pneumophila]ARB91880.1 protein translocase subunit SecF [Legionella longbeachae]ARM34933.1 protein translocase subunit SecF [Legionella longbeachae]EEZ95605.1 protein-export membrane protein SecF [Legionella longbeachae D-4968]